jgi:hypothetical protein
MFMHTKIKIRKKSWIILFATIGLLALIHHLVKSEPKAKSSDKQISETPNNTAPDAEAIAAVDLIMRHTGLPSNFEIMASDSVENAAAISVVKDGALKRVILYNLSFMDSILMRTESALAQTFVLAHEIGHHLCGHTLGLDTLISQHTRELEADKFAGFVLFRLGATLEQAEIVIRKIAGDIPSLTHPAKEERLIAIRKGWLEAQALAGEEMSMKGSLQSKTHEALAQSIESAKITDQTITAVAAEFHEISIMQSPSEVFIEGKIALRNLKERDCVITAWFSDDKGNLLRDLNQKYRTRSGHVATSVVVRPTKQHVLQQAIRLAIPKKEMDLGVGQHRIVVYLGLSVADIKFSTSSKTGYMFFIENSH